MTTVDIETGARFIAIEGLDGAGTTTQATRLAEALEERGEDALYTYEPSDGPIGTMIRQVLAGRVVIARPGGISQPMTRETLALLFAADRLDHIASRVDPALEDGVHVVTDRYYHSSLAYQGDLDDAGVDDFTWVRSLNSRARAPDITFYLDATPELCAERLGARRQHDIYENLDKLRRLRERYQQVIEMLTEEGQQIVRLDAAESIESIHDQILEHLDAYAGS
jgi:dTMP kinase